MAEFISVWRMIQIITRAVFFVALYGTSESVARCLPASNTLRVFLVTFLQIDWCLAYDSKAECISMIRSYLGSASVRDHDWLRLFSGIILDGEIVDDHENEIGLFSKIIIGNTSCILLRPHYSFSHAEQSDPSLQRDHQWSPSRLQRHSNPYLTKDSVLNCRPQTWHGCKRKRRVGNSTRWASGNAEKISCAAHLVYRHPSFQSIVHTDVNVFCTATHMMHAVVEKKVIDSAGERERKEFLLWQQQHWDGRTDRNSCQLLCC